MKKQFSPVTLSLLLAGAFVGQPDVGQAAPKPSGIYGKVKRIGFPPLNPETNPGVPTMGDEYEISNCTVVVRLLGSGHEVARTKTNEHGNFKITLEPGKYVVEPLDAGSPSQLGVTEGSKEKVTVWKGFYSEARAVFDGGW
jgi:hypothetical protein